MNFPFNCYEEEEVDGVTINPEDYAQNYMVVKLTRGKMVTVDLNDTMDSDDTYTDLFNTTNSTSVDVCVEDDSANFYKKFATITNKCLISKQGGKYYWYYAACTMEDGNGNESAVYLERWDGFNCTGNMTRGYPLYKPDGCEVKWNKKFWYTEVVTCTHPDYSIGAGYRNADNRFIVIMVVLAVAVYNWQ